MFTKRCRENNKDSDILSVIGDISGWNSPFQVVKTSYDEHRDTLKRKRNSSREKLELVEGIPVVKRFKNNSLCSGEV